MPELKIDHQQLIAKLGKRALAGHLFAHGVYGIDNPISNLMKWTMDELLDAHERLHARVETR